MLAPYFVFLHLLGLKREFISAPLSPSNNASISGAIRSTCASISRAASRLIMKLFCCELIWNFTASIHFGLRLSL